MLPSLVDKSNINKQLEVYNNQGNPDTVAGDFGRHSLYKMLGYFSLVGLLLLRMPLLFSLLSILPLLPLSCSSFTTSLRWGC